MLETEIKKLTEAVKENTAAIQEQNANIAEALAAAGGGKAQTQQRGRRRAGKQNPDNEAPSADDLKNVFVAYLASEQDEEGKQRLIDSVKPIVEHFGVERITQIKEEDRAEAIKYGKQLVEAHEAGGLEAAEAVKLEFSGDPDPSGGADSVL